MQAQFVYRPPVALQQSFDSIESHRKFARITPQIKHQLLKKVLFQNLNIKRAAKMLNINYSSAKSILISHRKAKLLMIQKNKFSSEARRASYTNIKQGDYLKKGINKIFCSIGGLLLSNYNQKQSECCQKSENISSIIKTQRKQTSQQEESIKG